MFKAAIIVSALALLLSQITALPSLLPNEKCSLEDSACLTKQGRLLLEAFTGGIPDLGIEKLDMLFMDSVVINNDKFDFKSKNVEMEGLKDSVIDKISIDMDLHLMKLSFRSTFTFRTNYTAEGSLFTFPINGSGNFKVIHRDVDFEIVILFDIIKKDGKDVMDLKTYRFAFDTVGDATFTFNNIINDDKKRSEKINSAINEYWRTVTGNVAYVPMKAVMEKIFNAVKIYMGSVNLEDIAIY